MITAPPPNRISVADSLRRMEQEARFGSFDAGRYRCNYLTWGSGPPLLFVHGMGDTLRSFVLPMAELSREFRCIAYNQPNGRNDGAKLRDYRQEHLVEDLFGLMDHLHLAEAPLVGHSFGSTIALRAMHMRPERVPRAVLVTGFAHRSLARAEYWLAWMARYWLGSMRHLPFRMSAMRKSHFAPFAERDPETWDFFVEQTGNPPIKAVAHWALTIHQTDVRDLLPEIRQPVMIVCGDRDTLVPHHSQEFLFRQLSSAVMFEIPGCGHFPSFTHPEALVAALRRFLHAPACLMSGNGVHCH